MATEDHGGEQASGLPQLAFETWPSQIFWLAIALVALYFILSRFVLPRVETTLQDRQDTISGDLDKAAEYAQQTHEAEASLAAALEAARAEARAIADQTQAAIKADLDVAIAAADARIAEQAAASAERIRGIEAEARGQATSVGAELAEAILGRFSPSAVDAGDVRAAVEGRIAQRFGA